MKNALTKKNVSILVGLIIIILFIQSVHGQQLDTSSRMSPQFKEGDILIVNHEPKYSEKTFLDTGKIKTTQISPQTNNQEQIKVFAHHAAIVIKDNNGNWAVRESLPYTNGVVTTPLETFYDREELPYVKVYRVDSEVDAQKAATWAKQTEGKWPTSYTQFVLPTRGDDTFYCAEYVWEAYKNGAGINIKSWNLAPWISPKSISLSDKAKEVFISDYPSQSATVPISKSSGPLDFLKTPAYGFTGGQGDTGTQNKDLGGVDFSQSHINYIALSDSDNFSAFFIGFKAQKSELTGQRIDLEKSNEFNLKAFFTALSLSDSKFWVNLNPWEPDRIIDSDLKKTDVGKVMLLADLQMKKDFSKYANPCESTIGKEYMSRLESKSEQLLKNLQQKYPENKIDSAHIHFSGVTRHWIVPDTIEAYKSNNEIFIVNASLTIKSDPVSDQSSYQTEMIDSIFFPQSLKNELDVAAKEYSNYAMETQEQLIRPLVIKDINSKTDYAELRQIFISIALAQAYKKEFNVSSTSSVFSTVINSNDLSSLESESPWSPNEIWKDYKKSFDEYDYTCTQSEEFVRGDKIITRSKTYIGGGVDFSDITIPKVSPIPDETRILIEEAQFSSYSSDKNNYYFGDYVVIPKNTENINTEDESPSSDSGFIDSIIQSFLGNLLEHRIYPGQYGSS